MLEPRIAARRAMRQEHRPGAGVPARVHAAPLERRAERVEHDLDRRGVSPDDLVELEDPAVLGAVQRDPAVEVPLAPGGLAGLVARREQDRGALEDVTADDRGVAAHPHEESTTRATCQPPESGRSAPGSARAVKPRPGRARAGRAPARRAAAPASGRSSLPRERTRDFVQGDERARRRRAAQAAPYMMRGTLRPVRSSYSAS